MPTSSAPSTRRQMVLVVASALIGASCTGGDGQSDAARFCGEIEANQSAITSPDLSSPAQIDALLELYRDVGRYAPIAIEAEWNQLTINYETASTVIPGDEASRQAAIATALQSEKSAARVKTWLVENCGLDIGPVDTLVPQSG